jgi:hypothetical protein
VLRLLDLPGAYSLAPRSPDERITRDVLAGTAIGEKRPDLIVAVVDASRLRRQLRLVLAAQRLGLPMLVVLNMADRAEQLGRRGGPATRSPSAWACPCSHRGHQRSRRAGAAGRARARSAHLAAASAGRQRSLPAGDRPGRRRAARA